MGSRQDFVETWLFETPEGIGQFELEDTLQWSIKDKIQKGVNVVNITDNFKKIEGNQLVYYWYEKDNKPILSVELEKKPQGLVVNALSKSVRGKPPYASDLYSDILKDQNKSIRIMSDLQLSDEGYKLWLRMFKNGHKIGVYNKNNPGQTFKEISSIKEFESYYGYNDTDFRNYQYVLIETKDWETGAFFGTRRMRELAGLALEDYEYEF